MKFKRFLARVARRAITLAGGGMVATGGDDKTVLVGVGLVLLELAGRELVEYARDRKAALPEIQAGGSL